MVRLALASFVMCTYAMSLEGYKLPLTSDSLQNDIKLSSLKLHSKTLQTIANKFNGTREFGSKGHNASVDYVSELVEAAGYKVARQTFPIEASSTTLFQRFVVGSPINTINISALRYSPSTPPGGLTAPLVLIPDKEAPPSAGCTPGDFSSVNVTGKIALIERGNCSFITKVTNAKAAGAIAVVLYNKTNGTLGGTLGRSNTTAYVPVGAITRADGQALVQRLAAGEVVRGTLDLIVQNEMRYSSNVIASSTTGNQSNVVFFGAHLDSVLAGPGINDDGSGSVTVLELALQLAKYKLTNAVRFAWWTAEEYGAIGSDYYVAELAEAERKKIALYINLDMVASPNYVYAIYDGDNSAGHNSVASPPGSGAIEKVFIDYFASKHISTIPTALDGRSDYGPFIAEGVNIPAGGLFTGDKGIKTEQEARLFGGTAGAAYDPNYHAKGDTYDNLNFDAFLVNAKACAHTLATFVQSTRAIEVERAAAAAPATFEVMRD